MLTPGLLCACLASSLAPLPLDGEPLDEGFEGPNGTLVDDLGAWEADRDGVLGPILADGAAWVAVRSSRPTAFLRPVDDLGTPDPADDVPCSWPLERTSGRSLRIEALVEAVPAGGPATLLERSALRVHLHPDPDTLGAPLAPRAVVDLVVHQGDVEARVLAEEPGQGLLTVGSVELGDLFAVGPRRVAVEFAWDYHFLPKRHGAMVGGQEREHQGKAWLYTRVSYLDGTAWVTPDPPEPRAANGWIAHGIDESFWYTNVTPVPVGPTHYGWADASADPLQPRVHPQIEVERRSMDYDWRIEEITIASLEPPPFAVFCNTLGYDTAAPQWAALRSLGPGYRDPAALASLEAEVRSDLDPGFSVPIASPPITGVQCLREVDDLETFDAATIDENPDPEDREQGFVFSDLYWWPLEWPAIQEERDGLYLWVRLSTADGVWQGLELESPRFRVAPEVHYRSLWWELAIENELDRRPGARPEDLDLEKTWGGWYDAGNDNGEARAHGIFLSGLAHVLRQRRAEMSTAEVQAFLDALAYGSDFVLLMAEPENMADIFENDRTAAHTSDCGHHVDDAMAVQGHVWEEHSSRHKGMPGGSEYDDGANDAKRIYRACQGLIDAARTLRPYDPLGAEPYYDQARNTRDYLYELKNHCGLAEDPLEPRLQATLDLAFYDYERHDGDGTSLDAAVGKLMAELAAHDPTLDCAEAKAWALEGQGVGLNAFPVLEPVLHAIEEGLLPAHQPSPTEVAAAVAACWYGPQADPALNPLWMTVFWGDGRPIRVFDGTVQRSCNNPPQEAAVAARLARLLGGDDPLYDDLVRLSTGSLNWLLGLHYGIRGRFAVPPSDAALVGASFLVGTGSLSARDNVPARHDWTHASLVAGVGGELFETTSMGTIGPDLPPWTYSAWQYGNTETFILRDGITLIGVEEYGRLLHPARVVEAEDYGSSTGSVSVEGNNAPPLRNGGESVTDLDPGESILLGVLPPAPDSGTYGYDLLLRAAHDASSAAVLELRVMPVAPGSWSEEVTLEGTGAEHDYLVVGTTGEVVLPAGQPRIVRIKVLSAAGKVSVDSLEFRCRGIPH